MGVFFGTDGLRGKVNEDLTFDMAFKVGNALSVLTNKPKVIIGSDTRITANYLISGVSGGVMSGGGIVLDVGIIPTAGIAYLVRELNADYGIVISASHNSKEYNGIKIFNGKGYKLGDKEEEKIERLFVHNKTNSFPDIGNHIFNYKLTDIYQDFLVKSSENKLNGITIVLDCANGAASKIAPKVFRKLGAKVIKINSSINGLKINEKCGALYTKQLSESVIKYGADMGFAFDGDADRLIAINEKGNVVDGDMLIFALSKYLKAKNKLKANKVVGTSHTNMAIEHQLKQVGIELLRTDIGDKYVLAKMLENDLSLGGEQSGHIILKDLHTTGDGVLSAIITANMVIEGKKAFSKYFNVSLYPQENISVEVHDKFKIMNSEEFSEFIGKNKAQLDGGRLMIRASGTEPKIRIMVESPNKELNKTIAFAIETKIKEIDKGI